MFKLKEYHNAYNLGKELRKLNEIYKTPDR